jgi:LAO/AO transport system kinase
VARRTREALLLCEAAGFDVVLVETVGVGQSETEVAGMVDCFVLLVQPGAGDEVQGIKRGIVEVADLVVVTKADRALAGAAAQAESDYRHALHFMRAKTPHWAPKVLRCSAVEGTGIDEVWTAVLAHQDAIATGDGLERERAAQAVASMWAEVRDLLVDSLTGQPTQAALAHELERKVRDGAMSPAAAAAALCRASTAPETPGGRGSP